MYSFTIKYPAIFRINRCHVVSTYVKQVKTMQKYKNRK